MPVDDRELLLEHLEAVAGRRERDAVRSVFAVVPARAESELDPAAAHRVGLRDLDRERAGKPERHGGHERAEPDPRRLAAERGERDPRVGRARDQVPRRCGGSGRNGRSASKPSSSASWATARSWS